MAIDPRTRYPRPPFAPQPQSSPGSSARMQPEPSYGEDTYKGSGKLEGRVALVTGANSGIGRAVALAFAKEGASVLLSYLNEEEDADAAARSIQEVGRQAVKLPGDIGDPAHCRALGLCCTDQQSALRRSPSGVGASVTGGGRTPGVRVQASGSGR